MALPTSGDISLLGAAGAGRSIRGEWAPASGGYNLRAYLKGAGIVTSGDTAPNVPSSGDITMRANFLGAAKYAGPPVVGDSFTAVTLEGTSSDFTGAAAYGGGVFVIASRSIMFRRIYKSGGVWVSDSVQDQTGRSTHASMCYHNGSFISIAESLPYDTSPSISTDGGLTWGFGGMLPTTMRYKSKARIFSDGTKVWVYLNDYMNKYYCWSGDGGYSWSAALTMPGFVDKWIYNPNDTLYKHRLIYLAGNQWGSNDGLSWTNLGAVFSSTTKTSWATVGDVTCVSAGEIYLWRKPAGSNTFSATSTFLPNGYARVTSNGPNFFAWGGSSPIGGYRSTDGGVSWNSVSIPPSFFDSLNVHAFPSPEGVLFLRNSSTTAYIS